MSGPTAVVEAPSGLGRAGLLLLFPVLLLGLFIGGLMTWHHDQQLYGAAPETGALIGCEESAEVSCDIVNTSEYSEIAGVPIATLAIPFYATALLLAGLALRGRPGARALLMVMGALATLYAVFLYGVSTQQLGYVCAWCLRSYGVNVALLVLAALGGKPRLPSGGLVGQTLAVGLGLLLVAVVGERAARGALMGDAPAGADLAAHSGDRSADPQGPAPARAIPVKTEDNREATLTLDPDDAWIGAADAQVTVVEFADLECGYCKRASSELARLEATYGDRVLFVFKHFPMDPACNPGVKNRKHREACAAAAASVCAQDQGRFWAFHDLAFKNQHQLDAEALLAYATKAGVDPAAFRACMAGPEAMARVRADAAAGASLDIHGTPRIFINGKLYRSGSSAEVMARAIEAALGATPQEAAARAAAMKPEAPALAPVPLDASAQVDVSLGALKFNIDRFEAAVVGGAARSARHQVPALKVSWGAARDACAAAGRRLCTEAEWLSACQGAEAVDDDKDGVFADDMIEGTAYPYGDLHEPERCWDGKKGDAFRPVYTGELPGCVSPQGAYDLTGNLEEWVGSTPETAALMGGAWDTADDHARCARRNDTFGAGYSSKRAGFRCCGD